MIWVLGAILSGIGAVAIRFYLLHFSKNLEQQVYHNFCEIFPQNAPHFAQLQSSLQPIKCGHFSYYFVAGAFYTLLCCYLIADPTLLFYWLLVSGLLLVIAKIDWHYQLIPMECCQLLCACGVASAYFQLSSLSLPQSLQSACCGFIVFWLIFQLAKYYYRQEALGRGDYWLVGALASFHPWQRLPLMIFLACLSALIFTSFQYKNKPKMLPFGPFLIIGHISTFMLNVLA
ncbi:prepilin peptidase [Pasteurellaceae bacterium 22721_9_1]